MVLTRGVIGLQRRTVVPGTQTVVIWRVLAATSLTTDCLKPKDIHATVPSSCYVWRSRHEKTSSSREWDTERKRQEKKIYNSREFNRNWSKFWTMVLLQVDAEHGSSVLRVCSDDFGYAVSILCLRWIIYVPNVCRLCSEFASSLLWGASTPVMLWVLSMCALTLLRVSLTILKYTTWNMARACL